MAAACSSNVGSVPPSSVLGASTSVNELANVLVHGTKEEALAAAVERGTVDRSAGKEVLSLAALVASARAIRPRPYLSTEYHAFLSAHAARDATNLYAGAVGNLDLVPIVWHIAAFKDAQLSHGGPAETSVPTVARPIERLSAALANWDEEGVESAAVSALRSGERRALEEILVANAARDLRDIGHKTIAIANGLRMARALRGEALESVVRSLALALLRRDGDKPDPATHPDAELDLPCAANEARLERIARVPAPEEGIEPGIGSELVASLRVDDADRASDLVVELVLRRAPLRAILDAYQLAAAELLLRAPSDVVALHAVTTMNSVRTCTRWARSERTRRRLALQGATRLVAFREYVRQRHGLAPLALGDFAGVTGHDTFDLDGLAEGYRADLVGTARAVRTAALGGRLDGGDWRALRRRWFEQANDFHDLKLPTAIEEEAARLPSASRADYLAATLAHLGARSGKPAAHHDVARRWLHV